MTEHNRSHSSRIPAAIGVTTILCLPVLPMTIAVMDVPEAQALGWTPAYGVGENPEEKIASRIWEPALTFAIGGVLGFGIASGVYRIKDKRRDKRDADALEDESDGSMGEDA